MYACGDHDAYDDGVWDEDDGDGELCGDELYASVYCDAYGYDRYRTRDNACRRESLLPCVTLPCHRRSRDGGCEGIDESRDHRPHHDDDDESHDAGPGPFAASETTASCEARSASRNHDMDGC